MIIDSYYRRYVGARQETGWPSKWSWSYHWGCTAARSCKRKRSCIPGASKRWNRTRTVQTQIICHCENSLFPFVVPIGHASASRLIKETGRLGGGFMTQRKVLAIEAAREAFLILGRSTKTKIIFTSRPSHWFLRWWQANSCPQRKWNQQALNPKP